MPHAPDIPGHSSPPLPAFLQGGGTMGQRIAALDWADTPLGPLAHWDAGLRAVVATVLHTEVAAALLWGPEGVMLYNDAYIAIAHQRHPASLGQSVYTAWPEVAAFNRHVMDHCLAGQRLRYTDQEFLFHRSDAPEQVWLTLNYSPVVDHTGATRGVLALLTETTERVRADRNAQSERERLRQMFAQAPGFMCLLSGPQHVFEQANAAYLQLIGRSDVVGKPVREALPEIAGQGYFEHLDRVYATGEPFYGEGLPAQLRRAPEAPLETRYIDLIYQPVRGNDGTVIGIFVQGADVTERHQAQEAVRLREAQFSGLAQALPHNVWLAQPDGTVSWVNERMATATGLTESALVQGGWLAAVHPDDRAATAARWAEALAQGQPLQTECRLRSADGGHRWHIARAVPLHGASGELLHWVGSHTDIEDQKSAARMLAHLNEVLEEQLAERTADRDRLWRLSTDIMVVSTLQGHIVSANPAWTTQLGWSAGELAGRDMLELVHPDDLAASRRELGTLAAGATTYRFENRCRRRDGSYATLMWTAVPDQQHIHSVGRDITADKAAADALRRTEAALYQAQKMESVGQLTGGVAHDFNNLLQVIAGNLQLLSRTATLDDRSQRYVGSALAGVQRGAKLASHLLAFARRQPLEPKAVHLGRFIDGMADMLRRTIGEEVDIRTHAAPDLWHCAVDPAQAENALLNLVLNARDAMAQGCGTLTIDAGNAVLDTDTVRQHPELAGGEFVLLTVADTGAGMPPDVAARVFEPFFSTKPEGKGTGLGLSMVYGFVKQSGGHVRIDSVEGTGTTVRLYLPRTTAEPDSDAPAASAPPTEGGHETVLVAEDDDAVRAAVADLLAHMGYQVLQARDAAAALAIVESGAAIDVLFTDVVMPGPLRSPELARRARERLPGLAVLFTSGYTQHAIDHGGRLDAGVELLSKPYTQDALARKIRSVLARARTTPQAPTR